MKLKPVRGEISTTNPMPNLGSSLVDAVKANAPQEQRVVNSLINLANKAKDTRGCILVGQGSKHNTVQNSRLSMDLLMKEILNLGGENIKLIIKNK